MKNNLAFRVLRNKEKLYWLLEPRNTTSDVSDHFYSTDAVGQLARHARPQPGLEQRIVQCANVLDASKASYRIFQKV